MNKKFKKMLKRFKKAEKKFLKRFWKKLKKSEEKLHYHYQGKRFILRKGNTTKLYLIPTIVFCKGKDIDKKKIDWIIWFLFGRKMYSVRKLK